MTPTTPEPDRRTDARRRLREQLAALEHEQWIDWSRHLAERERLSEERLARWRSHWVAYEQLDEGIKDDDRLYADRVLALLDAWGLLPSAEQHLPRADAAIGLHHAGMEGTGEP